MFTQDVFRAFTRGFDDVVIAAEVDTVWFSVPFMNKSIGTLFKDSSIHIQVYLNTEVFK